MTDFEILPITDAELTKIADQACISDRMDMAGHLAGHIATQLIETRKALAECGEKLAHRDKKIAELRELIHAGAMPAGARRAKPQNEPKRNTRPPRKPAP